MKLKYQFMFQPLGDTYMAVAVGESAEHFHGMMQLNEVGHDIVSLMANDISRDEIVDRIYDNYETDKDTVTKYVDEIIDYLAEKDVLIP